MFPKHCAAFLRSAPNAFKFPTKKSEPKEQRENFVLCERTCLNFSAYGVCVCVWRTWWPLFWIYGGDILWRSRSSQSNRNVTLPIQNTHKVHEYLISKLSRYRIHARMCMHITCAMCVFVESWTLVNEFPLCVSRVFRVYFLLTWSHDSCSQKNVNTRTHTHWRTQNSGIVMS